MQSRPTFRVLLIEDSDSDADLIQVFLAQVRSADYIVEWADTLADGIARVEAGEFDVILLDLSLPDSFGMDTCKQAHAAAPHVPIIVLTGLDDEDAALGAIKVGAQDFLVKGKIDGDVLSRGIRYAIERQKTQAEVQEKTERLRLISEQLPAVIWTTDTNLHITAPSTEVLVPNKDGRDLVGVGLTEYFETDNLEFPPIAAHSRAVQGASVSLDYRWKGLSLSVHVEPLRDAVGTIIGTIGVSLDVSSELRMQDELNAARHVQQALFPRSAPEIEGFDIAGVVYAAEETAGDYFDYIPMADDCIGLVVGDVTGHGLGPGLLMAELRAYLRALAGTKPHSGEILMLANRFLSADLEEHRFVTLFYIRLDPVNRSFTYASAGHCGYLIKSSGDVETLKSTGLPLGLIADTIFNTSLPTTIEPGDILFVPTDGFQEAHKLGNELYSLERTLQFIADRRDNPALEILEALKDDVCDFVGSPHVPDDMTAIIARCLP